MEEKQYSRTQRNGGIPMNAMYWMGIETKINHWNNGQNCFRFSRDAANSMHNQTEYNKATISIRVPIKATNIINVI